MLMRYALFFCSFSMLTMFSKHFLFGEKTMFKKFFQLFFKTIHKNRVFVLYHLRDKKTLTCTLTTEYTFIRYVPVRGRELQPNEGAPRPSCPSG